MFHNFLRYTALCLGALLMTACGGDDNIADTKNLNENTPEYAVVKFMHSIYLEDNIDTALSLSTDSMARVLKRYHTNSNVQRHLLNLKYDTVEITPEGGGRVGRNEFAEKSTITVFFSGEYNHERIEDMRSVDMVRERGNWKVDRIHPDRFM